MVHFARDWLSSCGPVDGEQVIDVGVVSVVTSHRPARSTTAARSAPARWIEATMPTRVQQAPAEKNWSPEQRRTTHQPWPSLHSPSTRNLTSYSPGSSSTVAENCMHTPHGSHADTGQRTIRRERCAGGPTRSHG
jgi:hypothetical protein